MDRFTEEPMRFPGPPEDSPFDSDEPDVEDPWQPACPVLYQMLNWADSVEEVREIYRVHLPGCPVCQDVKRKQPGSEEVGREAGRQSA
jgi:hypothetical protein